MQISHIEEVLGIPFAPVQVNHSYSRPGVIRGVHAEGWNKLVYVALGTALCQWVDLRPESPTFLQSASLTMSDGRGVAFIPEGVGNSFGVVGEDPVHYIYLVDRTYDQRDPSWDEIALSPFDPELSLEWPIEDPVLSERDVKALSLEALLQKMGVERS